jgi:hypothetical protein
MDRDCCSCCCCCSFFSLVAGAAFSVMVFATALIATRRRNRT